MTNDDHCCCFGGVHFQQVLFKHLERSLRPRIGTSKKANTNTVQYVQYPNIITVQYVAISSNIITVQYVAMSLTLPTPSSTSLSVSCCSQVVVNVTQCHRGCVETHYATGTALAEVGVVRHVAFF